ncbi:hypothetical protein [Saccharicrinis aurantiacus]|uniref:hypothetical protein n=1 Tax=Saccharicrinis aurantiacus TaxID=1849719 RepID=UPI00094FFF0A|nr:hypothetical protein [Saccharicrinis aurantiacus]
MLNNLQQEKGLFWIIPISVILILVSGIETWSAIGLCFAVVAIIKVLLKMGHSIPIVELMVSMSALQWIIGPFIDYHNGITHYKYHMYVPESEYMAFIVPALLLFYAGTLWYKNTLDLDELSERVSNLLDRHPKLPFILVATGLAIPFINGIVPPALRFIFFLLSNVKYVGAIYLLFSNHKNRWTIFMSTMALTALASMASGMFHDLLLWSMLTFTFVAKELQLSTLKKISIGIIGMLLAITIQSVKADYRAIIHKGYSGNKAALFIGMATENWRSGGITNPTNEENMTARLNQGWIISAVMYHVPQKEPYAGGSTIIEALEASLLPRFLAPNKKKAGGRENFMKYTGLPLGDNTSMGISISGEAYANYGKYGGMLFMLIWGMFISWFWKKLGDLSNLYPTLLIWSPILFLQVIKAETEFVVVLNHLIKSGVLVFGLLWFIKKQWRITI